MILTGIEKMRNSLINIRSLSYRAQRYSLCAASVSRHLPECRLRATPSVNYAQLSHRRNYDPLPLFVFPGIIFYFIFTAWKPKRDSFTALCGTTIATTKFGKVQYKVIDPEKKLGELKTSPNSPDENTKTALPDHPTNQDVVVFFHGTPGACDQYAAISNVTTFQLPFPVISISRPGCLGTELAKRLTLSDISELYRYMLEDQFHLIDSSRPASSANRIHLLAVGRGGLYALHFAHTYPSLVSSLTLMSCATRLEGYRLPLGNKGYTEYLEKDMLAGILLMELRTKKKLVSDIVEMVNTGAIKRGTKKAFQGIFRNEFSDDGALLQKLVESYSSGNFYKNRPSAVSQHTNEFAFNLLRLIGLGHVHSKKVGTVNDLCNTCGIEIDFESASRLTASTSFKALLDVARQEAERRSKPKTTTTTTSHRGDAEQATTKTTPWQSILDDIKRVEGTLRPAQNHPSANTKVEGQPSLISVDNQSYLSEIKCPTLILHSPDDGKLQYTYHAVHAAKHLPNAKLETFELFPHTLPLKDPQRVSSTITSFIQSRGAVDSSGN